MVVVCSDTYPEDITVNEGVYEEHFNTFSFPLSPFQKHSIQAIVDGEHTLVTAHTGSGKTLPIEFAIRHFVRQGKRVVYLGPLKSLVDQKYYDFTHKFPDITFGIMTSDIKYQPNAQVLIMTTEIFMNFLFTKQARSGDGAHKQELSFELDLENELACVCLDEVHFILDEQRGHVWEKTLLMLPAHVQLILLSATLSDPLKLAHFVENRYCDHPKQVVMSSTSKRIVPLNHYAYVITTEGAYKKIKDKETQTFLREATHRTVLLKKEDGVFQETGYNTVKKVKQLLNTHQIYIKRSHVLNTLSKHLVEHDMLPAIVFTFSRKNVEQCAHEITTNLLEFDSKVPYTARRMAEQIVRKLPNYHEYLGLPEYESLVQLLEKGVAIHHSGMIPILREVVELFIERKMVKMLFATDSFSVGLNCAIKTTVFTGLRKFDGVGEQFLAPHLYSQCAGRAGRRGMDTVGHVIHCANLFDLPCVTDYREILCGKPQKMESKFHIAYDVVLNLIKNGQHTDFHTFVEKSMIYEEIQASQQALKKQIDDMTQELHLKEEFMQSKLRTPVKVMAEYTELKETLKAGPQKKRKEVERSMLAIEDKYKCSMFYKDLEFFKNVETLRRTIADRETDLNYLATFIRSQVAAVLAILEERKFITTDNVVLPTPYTAPGLTHTETFDKVVTVTPLVPSVSEENDNEDKDEDEPLGMDAETDSETVYDTDVPGVTFKTLEPQGDMSEDEYRASLLKWYEEDSDANRVPTDPDTDPDPELEVVAPLLIDINVDEEVEVEEEEEGKEEDKHVTDSIAPLVTGWFAGGYFFTQQGRMAASIADVHPLVFVEWMHKLHHFEEFSVKEIIGLLSCFTDIRVKEDVSVASPAQIKYRKFQAPLTALQAIYRAYNDLECEHQIYPGKTYQTACHFDVIEEMMQWSDLEDMYACKGLLQGSGLADKGISVGDFSKAVLKICVIAKELIHLCEQEGLVSLHYKLSLVSKRMLKYICTNQSLYV